MDQSNVMLAPGAKRASAAGLTSDGAGNVAGGVAVGVGVGVVPRVTVSCAEVVVSKNAVIVTVVFAVTAKVVMAKLALVWPPGTLTMPGACAADALLVESVTEIPPAGAGALRNTVPVAFVPPVTLVGVIDIDCKSGGAFGSGATLTKMDFVTPPALAKTNPPVGSPETGLVAMAKLTALFPAGIDTLAGT